jgi:hypothetical protein
VNAKDPIPLALPATFLLIGLACMAYLVAQLLNL